MIAFTLIAVMQGQADTLYCSSVTEIRNAFTTAQAGDEIIILDGIYQATDPQTGGNAYFRCDASGTAADPIVIRGQSANGVHLKGNNENYYYVLYITGDWVVVKDLELSTAEKGLMFDNANHCTAYNIRTHFTGMEAFHVRDGSTYIKLEQCDAWDTGYENAGYAEGYYVGTDKGSWSTYNEDVNHIWIKNCNGGPDVGAELFDVKEGSWNVLIDGGNFDSSGISGANYADSFVDLKGTYSFVRNAVFDAKNESTIQRAVMMHDRDVGAAKTANHHVVHGCDFRNVVSGTEAIAANSGTSEIYAYDNFGGSSSYGVNGGYQPSWYAARIAAITDETQYPEVILFYQGDLNIDGEVDLKDVAELSLGWQTEYDLDALLDIADNWLYGIPK